MRGVLLTACIAVAASCGPSDECARYVACQKAYDNSVDTSAYESGGSCWGALQTADACSAQCRQALDALSQVPDPPAPCRP